MKITGNEYDAALKRLDDGIRVTRGDSDWFIPIGDVEHYFPTLYKAVRRTTEDDASLQYPDSTVGNTDEKWVTVTREGRTRTLSQKEGEELFLVLCELDRSKFADLCDTIVGTAKTAQAIAWSQTLSTLTRLHGELTTQIAGFGKVVSVPNLKRIVGGEAAYRNVITRLTLRLYGMWLVNPEEAKKKFYEIVDEEFDADIQDPEGGTMSP